MTNTDAPPPPHLPLGVKLTAYKLLNMSVILSFGLAKGILTYMGQSVAPTTLDWVAAALLAVILYWIGQYESTDTSWEWFFHIDLTYSICYGAKRFVGGVAGVLFVFRGTPTITALSSIPVALLAHFVSHIPLDVWLAVYIVLTACVNTVWLRTQRRPTGGRVWKTVTEFLEVYGLNAPLAEQHEWLGSAGAVLGFWCGMALVWSPLAILYFSI
ncbi:hypothetical protein BGW80DRAFT_894715 [Lactifluus volemus]|nr:hypothetical protein BGW80DRAFT_894715 [Lactifluus volemus]